ncbi:MAG: hypothetical protein WCJ35_10410 [Planctomycetota bacterium]
MSHFASNRSSTIPARTFQFSIFNFQFSILLIALTCSFALSASSVPLSDSAFRKAPTWHPPQVSDVKVQVVAWLQQNAADAALQGKALAVVTGISDQATGSELLDRLAETFAIVDPKVAQLVEICSRPRNRIVLPTFAWMTDSKTAPLVAANMRLYYGRWLVQGQWFEEAMEQLGGLKTAEVVAPAELLFYQGVTYHRMLNKSEGLKVIGQLLDGAEASPRRYVAVAYLMQADLNSLEEETLDHIARRMEDVQRRLNLGRAGPKVRKVENGVIESLDKMIKKIEDEQSKQNQSQSDSLQSSSPAKDSTPMGGKAPGDVTKKDIGHKGGWGDLPPKQREEALQQMGRDFPPHFRDAIEEYFRKLASEENSDDDK